MQYRRIGDSPLEASVVGLGALHFGVYLDQAQSAEVIHRALDLGINFIDTAPMYGHEKSERFVGNAIHDSRDKVIVSTKVGLKPVNRPDGTFGSERSPVNRKNLTESIDKSLKELRIEQIDLLQLHSWDYTTPFEETLEALDGLVNDGKIAYIGCSNYSDDELMAAEAVALANQADLPFVSFQCYFNVIERRAGDIVHDMCRDRGIGLICSRALSRGLLSGRYMPQQAPPEGSRGADSKRIAEGLKPDVLSLVQGLSGYTQSQGRTTIELAISWLLSRPGVSIVLVGCRNLEQLETCARGASWTLSKEELAEIDSIIASHGMAKYVNSTPEVFLEK